MDYFKLTNGNSVRVTDMSNEMWTIDMVAEGNYASIYDDELWYVPMSDIAYEISALDMAVYMLKSMGEMDWADGDHIMTAVNLLKEKFKDELEFIVSFNEMPSRPAFRIDIQELGPLPNYTSVVWSYNNTAYKQIWFGSR